jgi:hypothetical protein
MVDIPLGRGGWQDQADAKRANNKVEVLRERIERSFAYTEMVQNRVQGFIGDVRNEMQETMRCLSDLKRRSGE